MQIQNCEVFCPYCGEEITLELDPSAGNEQNYIEDCQVCCRPMVVHVQVSDEAECSVEVESAST